MNHEVRMIPRCHVSSSQDACHACFSFPLMFLKELIDIIGRRSKLSHRMVDVRLSAHQAPMARVHCPVRSSILVPKTLRMVLHSERETLDRGRSLLFYML